MSSPAAEEGACVAAAQRVPHPFSIHPVRVWNDEGSMNPNQLRDTALYCCTGHEVPVVLQDTYLRSREGIKVGSHLGNHVCHEVKWITA